MRRNGENMGIIKADDVTFEYIRRDEEGNVEGITTAVDHVSLDIAQGAPTGAMAFHYHDFYEIIYVLEGEYSSMVEDKTYHMKKGDFLLIDQNVMHKYHYVEKKHDSSRRIILWISGQMLGGLGGGDMNLAGCFKGKKNCVCHFPIYYEEMLQGFLLKLAMTQMQESGSSGAKRTLDRGLLTMFFVYLNILCAREEYLTGHEVVSHPLVEQVSAYIDAHLTETITVELLAAQVHVSKYYFLRKFKELTGVTVHSFLIDKRLIRACEILRSSPPEAASDVHRYSCCQG